MKRDLLSPVTVSILRGLETRGPRENSEKLRPTRPVRLGDDVRDIESLGGSPPSRRLARARLHRISVSLAFIRGLRPVLFFVFYGPAMPIVSWLESCRLASREI